MIRRSLFKEISRDRSGSIAMMFAIFLPVAVLCLGIAIDLMMLFTEKRKAQGVADIAAIIAAQASSDPEQAAREILSINGYDVISSVEMGRLEEEERKKAVETKTEYEVIPGRYVPNPDQHYRQRFVAGQTPYNAAKVNVKKKGELYFVDHLFDTPTVAVSATASWRALAAFSVGSRLASVDDGLLNELLGALLGTEVSLSVLDYDGLMGADIEVFGFLNALASEMSIEAGQYDDVLKSDPTLPDVLAAMMQASGEGPAADALATLRGSVGGQTRNIDLAKVINLGPAGIVALGEPAGAGFPAYVSAFDLIFANAVVAEGKRLLHLDLAATVPGLASLKAVIAIGEPMQSSPWFSIGQGGQTVSNVQARIYLEASVGGEGLLSGAEIRLPVYIEAARATGELLGVECPGGRMENIVVRLGASTSVADAWIGDVDISLNSLGDDVEEARLITAPALSAWGKAHAGTASSFVQPLGFTWDDIAYGTVKTTATEDIARVLVENLINDLDLDVSTLGITLISTSSLSKSAVADALGALSVPVSDVIDQLLEALGISVGEGVYRVNGAKCDHAVLVQ
ncbi:TadG family pilus assembly protein [Hyphococcus flavus]|uniref:TadG family pilus assembly protein n=1 Tax=Hyphococcus flavus TaxID=1866326 RepID=A0AAF0CG66_9PROT|nr:TadG family pilus assembly protein [Hyphococcus flavus]WDI33146.1 TadG family pilus assembly protein [Hyphococcus flavus]